MPTDEDKKSKGKTQTFEVRVEGLIITKALVQGLLVGFFAPKGIRPDQIYCEEIKV